MRVGRGSARQPQPCPRFSADTSRDGLATVRILTVRGLELAATLLAACSLRAGWALAAGALVSLAALVRIHPAFLVLGPGFQLLGQSLRARRLALGGELGRLLAGGLAGAALLVAAAGFATGGLSAWQAFAENSRVLLDTPLRNHMGLPTLLAWNFEADAERLVDRSLDDAYAPWKESRRVRFEARRPLFVAIVLASLALFAWAVQGQPLWVALVLGAGMVPIATELTCYYSALLVVFALLHERAPWASAGLVGLSAAGWAIVDLLHTFDPIFTGLSLATVLYCLGVLLGTGLAARRPQAAPLA